MVTASRMPARARAPVSWPVGARRPQQQGSRRTRPRADGAQEVGNDGERADAHAPKGCRGRDVAVELLFEGLHRRPVPLPQRARPRSGARRGAQAAAAAALWSPCAAGPEPLGTLQGRRGHSEALDSHSTRPTSHSPCQHVQTAQRVGRTARNICCSFSCLATSLAELPETSIQVLLNSAQAPSMNTM